MQQEKIKMRTGNDIKSWIRERQEPFWEELEEFGRKSNRGYQTILRGQTCDRKVSDIQGGEFTGTGLCRVANAALGMEIIRRFWMKGWTVSNEIIATFDRNTQRGSDLHNILRIKRGETQLTADPTLKQIIIGVRPGMVPIFPTENEAKVYPRLGASRTEPILLLWADVMAEIKSGGYERATMKDYQRLTRALRD